MDQTCEKRERLRIDFETQVVLKFQSINLDLKARMKNISMKGIFVETDKIISLDTPCQIEVVITAPSSKLTIQTEGFVSRHDPEGLGVKFKDNMEWFAFFSIFEYYGRGNDEDCTNNTKL